MLCLLTMVKESVTHTPTLIMKDGGSTLPLGVDLGTTPCF